MRLLLSRSGHVGSRTWLQSGRILPDGGAFVGDFGSGTLYRIGADGSVIARWGGKGEGPLV